MPHLEWRGEGRPCNEKRGLNLQEKAKETDPATGKKKNPKQRGTDRRPAIRTSNLLITTVAEGMRKERKKPSR